jgi:hypothetical protein
MMTNRNLMIIGPIVLMVGAIGQQLGLARIRIPAATAQSKADKAGAVHQPKEIAEKKLNEYERQIAEKLAATDFSWIDQEAARVRASKERLPGGYWKLRALYGVLEKPAADRAAPEPEWEARLKRLVQWSRQRPQSITAKVALATAWKEYAWKARGGGYSDTVGTGGWKLFAQRLDRSAAILSEASALKERCPHWYVTSLLVGLGQQRERSELDKVFEAGIKLEPTYYYLYQAKTTYLLPQWGGAEGAWARFAEESARAVGGDQGNIVFFAIYSQVLSIDGMDFIFNHHDMISKLIAGFRSIEKLYGSAPKRLNEACFFAAIGEDVATINEFFDRIGDDYDLTVWRSKENFERFRAGARQRAKASKNRLEIPGSPSSSTSGKAPAKN